MKYYKFYMNTKKGSGWHSFLVLKEGRKWVKLFSTERTKPLKIKRVLYDELMKTAKELQIPKERVIERLKNTALVYKTTDTPAVKEALEYLKNVRQRVKLNVTSESTKAILVRRK